MGVSGMLRVMGVAKVLEGVAKVLEGVAKVLGVCGWYGLLAR